MRGRKARAEAASNVPLRVRLSPTEYELVKTAAKVNRQNLSQFVREAIDTAAGDCLERRRPNP